MAIILNVVAGAFIVSASGFIKLPAAIALILMAKAVSDPPPPALSFFVGLAQDAFGYVCSVWIAVNALRTLAGVDLSWILLAVLCPIIAWLNWERVMNASVAKTILWHERGCNVGRIVGLIAGGIRFL
ncbi:MAG: hypothetical protein FJW39_24175 [Acidobacteria bacterium]|nr:hypothetical protein [Acidobacteriota bacterium]